MNFFKYMKLIVHETFRERANAARLSFRRIGSSVLPSPHLPKKARFCRLLCLKTALSSYHVIESKVDTTDIFYGDDLVRTEDS